MLDRYYPVVNSMVKRSPDLDFFPIKIEEYEKNYSRLPQLTEENYQKYLASLDKPMPFFLGIPKRDEESWSFVWDPSYDLQNDDLTYDFQISRDPAFQTIVTEATELLIPRHQVQAAELPPGIYYWRAIARDSKGHRQIAFDKVETDEGEEFFGVKRFHIRPLSP